jgi:uncharacterized Zn finger protein
MRVNVRNIVAQCPKCGGEEFDAVGGKRFELASQTTMRCMSCAATCTYVDLVMQIAQKALAASAATLEDVRRRRGK